MTPNRFAELDEILCALVAKHAGSKRPSELEATAPSRMREIWEAIGYGPATSEAFASGPPLTLAGTETELGKIFGEWAASPKSRAKWNAADVAAFRAHLPARCRLVRRRADEIDVTDESGESDDPPVLAMRQEQSPVIVWHARYSEWLIWELLGIVAGTRSTGYNELAALPGQQVLQGVYPTMWKVADRIWRMEMPPFSRKDESPQYPTKVLYASVDEYLAFVIALPDDKIVYMRYPRIWSIELRSAGPLDLFEGTPPGFRVFQPIGFDGKPERGRKGIGRVGDTIVMLGGQENGPGDVGFNPKKRDEVLAWLKGLKGVKIAAGSEFKLRPGYDKFGW